MNPAVSGFEKCVYYLIAEQSRTHLIAVVLVFFKGSTLKLVIIFAILNFSYCFQLITLRGVSWQVSGWLNFGFCLALNYY